MQLMHIFKFRFIHGDYDKILLILFLKSIIILLIYPFYQNIRKKESLLNKPSVLIIKYLDF